MKVVKAKLLRERPSSCWVRAAGMAGTRMEQRACADAAMSAHVGAVGSEQRHVGPVSIAAGTRLTWPRGNCK